jgi:hypothetical protein
VRRTQGLHAARVHSLRAFKSPYSSWQLVTQSFAKTKHNFLFTSLQYVTAARIELFMNREHTPARKVFEHGLKTHSKHIPYLTHYVSALYSMNEEANMRVMFDNFMKDSELCGNRELWDEYLRFEVTYGNQQSIEHVRKRRADALGNAVDPNGIFGAIHCYKVVIDLCCSLWSFTLF